MKNTTMATKSEKKTVLVICPNPSIDIYAYLETMEKGSPNRLSSEHKYPGGKGIHVAMALSELEIDVILIGFWGSTSGQWIRGATNRYYPKIRIDGIDLDQWSRTCLTFKTKDDFDHTEILGTGPSISNNDEEALLSKIQSYLPHIEAVVCSGSWPKKSNIGSYKRIIELANKYDIPSFIDCTGDELTEALKAKPFGIHLNRKEIETLYNTTDFQKARNQILDTCEEAYITDGKKGLYHCTKNSVVNIQIKLDTIISTVGAGDCLLAGVVAGHIRNLDSLDTAALGAASGSANCIREDLGMLNKHDVENLLDQTIVSLH